MAYMVRFMAFRLFLFLASMIFLASSAHGQLFEYCDDPESLHCIVSKPAVRCTKDPSRFEACLESRPNICFKDSKVDPKVCYRAHTDIITAMENAYDDKTLFSGDTTNAFTPDIKCNYDINGQSYQCQIWQGITGCGLDGSLQTAQCMQAELIKICRPLQFSEDDFCRDTFFAIYKSLSESFPEMTPYMKAMISNEEDLQGMSKTNTPPAKFVENNWIQVGSANGSGSSPRLMIGKNPERHSFPDNQAPQLAVICSLGHMGIMIEFKNKNPHYARNVSLNDRSTYYVKDQWLTNPDNNIMYYKGNVRDLINHMKSVDQMHVAMLYTGGGGAAAMYDVKGLSSAIKPLEKECAP